MARNVRLMALVFAAVALVAVPTMAQKVPFSPPTGPPGSVPEATGGPDTFGYTYFDQADGCTFDFVDISGTGTALGDGDDTAFTQTLGASFNFYGVDYNDMAMGSNGYLTTNLADTGGDFSNDCPIPDATFGADMLAPLWNDLDLEPGIGQAYYEYFDSCPRPNPNCGANPSESCSVFMWDDVANFPGGAGAAVFDMNAILYHDSGDFVYQIGSGNPDLGATSTTGWMDATASDGLTYACNTNGSIPDNTAVCVAHPAPSALCLSVLAIPTASSTGLLMLTVLILLSGVAMLIVLRRRQASA